MSELYEIENYKKARREESYDIFKKGKFFRKARAFIVRDNKIILLKYYDKERGVFKYIIPGGGINPGENAKAACVREALEEIGVEIKPYKYIGKEYYNIPLEFDGKKYLSKRVNFFYMCKFVKQNDLSHLGLVGEFDSEKITIDYVSLEDLLQTKHYYINNITKKTYEKLVNELKKIVAN